MRLSIDDKCKLKKNSWSLCLCRVVLMPALRPFSRWNNNYCACARAWAYVTKPGFRLNGFCWLWLLQILAKTIHLGNISCFSYKPAKTVSEECSRNLPYLSLFFTNAGCSCEECSRTFLIVDKRIIHFIFAQNFIKVAVSRQKRFNILTLINF